MTTGMPATIKMTTRVGASKIHGQLALAVAQRIFLAS